MSEMCMSTEVGHCVHRWLLRQMAAVVYHKVWVVVHDPQDVADGVQDSLTFGG